MLTFKIPETEHLSTAEREDILRRALASDEVLRFRRDVPKFVGIVPTVLSIGFLFMAVFRWRWNFAAAAITFFGICVVSAALAIFLKIWFEVRIARKVIRRELQK